MEISKAKFEEEFYALIDAALSTSNKETAKGFLNKAGNKINAYDNIQDDLKRLYKRAISDAEDKIGL